MKPGHGFGDQSMKSGRFGKWARALGDRSGGGGRGCLVRARCSTDQPNHSLGLGLLLGLGPLRGCSLRWCLKIVCLMNAARFLPLGRPGPLMETDGLAETGFSGSVWPGQRDPIAQWAHHPFQDAVPKIEHCSMNNSESFHHADRSRTHCSDLQFVLSDKKKRLTY